MATSPDDMVRLTVRFSENTTEKKRRIIEDYPSRHWDARIETKHTGKDYHMRIPRDVAVNIYIHMQLHFHNDLALLSFSDAVFNTSAKRHLSFFKAIHNKVDKEETALRLLSGEGLRRIDPNQCYHRHPKKGPMYPLIRAVFMNQYDLVCELLSPRHGTDINQRSTGGGSALFYAAQQGFFDMVDILLEHGANPHSSYKTHVHGLTGLTSLLSDDGRERAAMFMYKAGRLPSSQSEYCSLDILPLHVACITHFENKPLIQRLFEATYGVDYQAALDAQTAPDEAGTVADMFRRPGFFIAGKASASTPKNQNILFLQTCFPDWETLSPSPVPVSLP